MNDKKLTFTLCANKNAPFRLNKMARITAVEKTFLIQNPKSSTCLSLFLSFSHPHIHNQFHPHNSTNMYNDNQPPAMLPHHWLMTPCETKTVCICINYLTWTCFLTPWTYCYTHNTWGRLSETACVCTWQHCGLFNPNDHVNHICACKCSYFKYLPAGWL